MSTNTPSVWTDTSVHVKFKLAALWTSVMFLYVYGDYFALYPPKRIEHFIQGTTMLDAPMKLLAASILMTIPSVMIFLSLVLTPRLSRLLNIIFGGVFTTIMLLIAVSSFVSFTMWQIFYIYLALVESVLTSLVVWYAWRWSNKSASVQ
jgi:hypothetical protein